MSGQLVASGGFCAPRYHTAREIEDAIWKYEVRPVMLSLPMFTAPRGGINFEGPAVRWAREREREMRRLTKMWDWP